MRPMSKEGRPSFEYSYLNISFCQFIDITQKNRLEVTLFSPVSSGPVFFKLDIIQGSERLMIKINFSWITGAVSIFITEICTLYPVLGFRKEYWNGLYYRNTRLHVFTFLLKKGLWGLKNGEKNQNKDQKIWFIHPSPGILYLG